MGITIHQGAGLESAAGAATLVASAAGMQDLSASDGTRCVRTDIPGSPEYEYSEAHGIWRRVHADQRRLMGRKVVNSSGASASVLLCPPGRRLYGGMLVASGAVDITVRDGHLVGADIIQIRPGAGAADARIAPIEVRKGLYVTLANNATVTFFASEADDTPPGAARPIELTPGVIASDGAQTLPLSASGRAWLGYGLYAGFNLTAQSGAGAINVYDGWTNGGTLIDTIASPVVGFRGGSGALLAPVKVQHGIFIELLGTGQNVTLTTGPTL